MKRCVIALGMEVSESGNGRYNMGPSLTISDLNYYTLFWDEILIPTTRVVNFTLPNEDEYIGLGIISRPPLEIWTTTNLTHEYIRHQKQLLEQKRKEERSSDWSLHQIGNEFIAEETFEEKNRGLRIEIFDALPIPDESVPLADIMEFKNRSQQAYMDFHGYLDDLYTSIIHAPDDPFLKSKSYLDFESSLDNIKKLNDDQWRGKLKKINFSWGFDSQKEVIDAFISGAESFQDALAGSYSSAITGMISTLGRQIKIERKEKVMLGSDNAVKGLRYLVNGYNEGLFKLRE